MCYANRIEFFRNTLKIIFKWHCSKRPFTETNIFIKSQRSSEKFICANWFEIASFSFFMSVSNRKIDDFENTV